MRERRRPEGRLCCCRVLWAGVLLLGALAWAQGPALTTISDTVYRADGTGASGTALISWPAFLTAGGNAVAAGNQSVAIGPGGAFSTQLIPNSGSSPAGTYYTVVFQLDDGTVRTEYWTVPTTSPTTITAVRTTPGSGPAEVMVTKQYVDASVATRAVDATVVHLSGTETITGAKQFATAPVLPAPVGANNAANKGYVDTAVANVGAGNYVAKAGDTMTGPLTLAGDPASPNQAATRHYADTGLAVKADLVNGVIPVSELGTGPANGTLCLLGNSTWGPCGTSSNAVSIQGIPVSTTAPTDGQVLTYQAASNNYAPKASVGGTGTPAGITYATTSLNWSQIPSGTLTGGTGATVTLTPCPMGIDTTSGAGYQVLLTGGSNSEAVSVTGGTCTSGGTSGTIVFTPFYSYAAGYSVGSASSGLQESINNACGVSPTHYLNGQCNVTIAGSGPGWTLNTYNVQGTLYVHTNQSVLSGYGVSLACIGRGPCLQIGNLTNSNYYQNNVVKGFSFRSPTNFSSNPSYAGISITQTARTSQVATITTASAHGFRVGDMVTILFTDSSAYWGDAFVTAVPSSTTFQYSHTGADIAANSTPGVVALAYEAILDNGLGTHFSDIQYDYAGENGSFNNFFDFWDDENASIDHFSGVTNLTANANWTGSFLFSAGNQGSLNQIAPVITLRDSAITATNPDVTVYNSNGIYIENTVLQASGPWQVYASNSTGNYQGAYLKNIYSESSTGANPLSPAKSPFAGTGIAGLIAGATSAAGYFSVRGIGGVGGTPPVYGSGSIHYSYFIVARDLTAGTQTSPMQAMNYNSTGSDSITVRWPRIANQADTITYDVIRAITPVTVGDTYPFAGGCNGGSALACGSVTTSLAQCSGLVCSYTDSGSATTSSYTVSQGSYAGNILFWPGAIVTVGRPVSVDVEHSNAVGIGLGGGPVQIAEQCSGYGTASSGGYTACPMSVINSGGAVANAAAALMTDGPVVGGGMLFSKGRLNFSNSPWANLQPHHIITLIDSQPALTRATAGYRPPANANDVWIGTDVPAGGVAGNQGQLAAGAPISISNYIGNIGDGTSWKERLSSTLREFNVPVKFDQSVTFSTPIAASISGNAGTATASDHAPALCTSGFATGVDVNWNAICGTADLIQLAETTAPNPVAGYGQLWFSSANHSPYFLTGTGQTAQIGYGNVFNSDPAGDPLDTIELRNGTNPQNFRVYQDYVDSTHWNRLGFGYDSANNGWMVIKSEWGSNTTSSFGLGFATGSSRKWEITTTTPNQLRPASSFDNNADLGDSTHRVRNLYLGSGVVFGTGTLTGLLGSSGVALEAGTIVGAGLPLCTDGSSNATTVGCPSGGGLGDPGSNGIVKRTALNMTGVAGGADVNAALGYTAANDAGVVHLAGTETVSGAKTFSASTTFSGNVTIGGALNLSATGPSLWQGKEQSSAPTITSGYDFGLYVDSTGHFQCLLSGGSSCNSAGSAGWGSITGTLSNQTDLQSALNAKANDAAVVHTSGNETIGGTKTFSSLISGSIAGNAGTAAALVSSPTTCAAGQAPTGILANGNATGCSAYLTAVPVSSVFGRTGLVAAQSGDYSVSQVTGAAPSASPTFTGTVTLPGYSAFWGVPGAVSTSSPIACSSTANRATVWGLPIGFPITTSHVTYYAQGADNTANTYDIGLYNTSGTLVAHTGALAGTSFAPSQGYKVQPWTSANVVLQPGIYYVALTCSATSSTATFGYAYSWSSSANTALSVATGGSLPATLTMPGVSLSAASTLQVAFY